MGRPQGFSLLLRLGLLSLLTLAALPGCQSAPSDGSPPTAGSGEEAPKASPEAASPETSPETSPEEHSGLGAPINPPRPAKLKASQPGAQINLRSQPTTQSSSQGYGLPGDGVQLQQLAEGEGGYSWYYIKFDQSGAEGWVRGDFIDAQNQAAAPVTADQPPADCGEDPQEAYFETKSFIVHICKTATGLVYVGTQKATQTTLRTSDVRNSQGTYIAINGSYQYHVNDNSLAVYQVDRGEYTQLQGEAVDKKARFH